MTDRRRLYSFMIVAPLLAPGAVLAQFVPPTTLAPPPPAPPPPPRVEVPVVPKLDAAPSQPRVAPARRGSYNQRFQNCLDEGTAAGLGPTERSAYARGCAN